MHHRVPRVLHFWISFTKLTFGFVIASTNADLTGSMGVDAVSKHLVIILSETRHFAPHWFTVRHHPLPFLTACNGQQQQQAF